MHCPFNGDLCEMVNVALIIKNNVITLISDCQLLQIDMNIGITLWVLSDDYEAY